jgi:chemotaxis protein histidine kinase CheA
MDDGRGIEWAPIAERARARGLPSSTEEDLVSALFANGLSTSTTVSALSGRGVGMSSVREVCAELGIRVEVESTINTGTCFRFILPDDESDDYPEIKRDVVDAPAGALRGATAIPSDHGPLSS